MDALNCLNFIRSQELAWHANALPKFASMPFTSGVKLSSESRGIEWGRCSWDEETSGWFSSPSNARPNRD